MKRKVHDQIQLPETSVLRNQRAEEEIQDFLEALNSYPARAAKQPNLTFQQHIGRILAAHEVRAELRRTAASRHR